MTFEDPEPSHEKSASHQSNNAGKAKRGRKLTDFEKYKAESEQHIAKLRAQLK